MNGPDAALAACRFLRDAAAMQLWGAFAFLAVLVPRDLACSVAERLGPLRRGAVAIAAVATAAVLPVQVAAIGGGWSDAIDPATVRAVLLDTAAGRAWQAQALAAVLLIATLRLPARMATSGTVLASGLLLASLALAGHPAMHEGWLGAAHRVDAALHVLAAGAWFGALLPLLFVLRALDGDRRGDARVALRGFSRVGHGAVALVLATGAADMLLVLGRWPLDPVAPYQAMLDAKIALVFIMTALAIVNRYGLVPRMGGSHGLAARALRLATVAEIGLGLAAIGCVGVFGLLDPA